MSQFWKIWSKNVLPFRVFVNSSNHLASTQIYEIPEGKSKSWRAVNFPVPVGTFHFLFEFTMGVVFESAAAIDDITIGPCSGEWDNVALGHEGEQGPISI